MPWDKLLLQQLLRETAVPVMPPVNTAVAMPGDEGRDCHDHDFAVVADAVVFLSEEDELAVVSVCQSHERCCCLHMPYLGMLIATDLGRPGCRIFFFFSLAGGGGSFFSSSGGGGGNAKTAMRRP
jgi:hypothetical protein